MTDKADHYIRISVSPDRMQAMLSLKPQAGIEVKPEEIFAVLDAERIFHGVNISRIHQICTQGEEVLKETIAEGTPSIPGTDATIEYLFQKPDLRPTVDSDEQVNFFELHNLVQVKPGDVLARKTPATPGIAGINVHGEPLKPMPGKNINIRIGKGVEIQGEEAVATMEGALEWSDDKISIGQLLFIDGDVDFAVGNIDFSGRVIVNGHVRSGFKIDAAGDIEIRGTVEDAVMTSSRGSIIVEKGIVGRQKAVITAHKNVEARFIQEATVVAGQNILVSEYIIRSEIKAGNAVLMTGVKGRIMGRSNVSAANRIKVNRIQADRDLKISVKGFNRNDAYARIKRINEEVAEAETEMKVLTLKMRMLREQRRPESLAQLKNMLPRYIELDELVESIKHEQSELVVMLRSTKGEGMIEIQQGVDDNMSFNIKNERISITRPLKNVTMYYDQDEKQIVLINN